ncbi:MAG: hypothetical protein J7L43_02550 [Candidatus Aenigmarchaeota archaeon]|nr:hypothetical protein [Candidatus Aenigmarchaeota archaeon]
MKGISLPINAIIIIALGIIVLLALAGWFTSQTRRNETNVMINLQKGCNLWKADNCNTTWSNFNVSIDGQTKTIKNLCESAGAATQDQCKEICGC